MFHLRELVDANRKEIASLLTSEHGKVLGDALGEVARGLENIEFACGIPQLLKGGYSEQASGGVDVYSIRQPLGRRRRHHAVQLPGHGPDVDVRQRHRLRQHVRPEAVREGPVRVAADGRPAPAGRAARRGVQRRAGRQGGRRPHPRAPGHRRRELRGLDAGRQAHLRDRHPQRQAGPGPRRSQEPHGRPAGRRRGHGGGRRGQRRLRLGRRALHGHLRGGRRRPRGRPAGRGHQGPPPQAAHRPRLGARQRDGAAHHPRAPGQGGRLPRQRGRARARRSSSTAGRRRSRATASSSACR